MERPGLVGRGLVRLGLAGLGVVRRGLVGLGLARSLGVARSGWLRFGLARLGAFDPEEGERLYWERAIDRIKAEGGLRGFVTAKREAQVFVQVNFGTTAVQSIVDLTAIILPALDRTPHPDPLYMPS